MIIGLNPNAQVLKVGIVDPNCSNNFRESAIADKQRRYLIAGFVPGKIVPMFLITLAKKNTPSNHLYKCCDDYQDI